MKNIINIKLFLLCILVIVSCEPNYQDLATENAQTGGLVEVKTKLVGYVIGDGRDYDVSLRVFQGETKTTSIQVLKTFTQTDPETGITSTSEEVEHETFTISEDATFILDFTVNYQQLREGITFNGAPLPETDSGLQIGDFFTFIYVSTTSNGDVFRNASSAQTKISVGTRFAGTYKVIASDYWRIGVQSGGANWVGENRIIESVDATTYFHQGYGPFLLENWPAEAFFYFSVDENYNISYFQEYNGATITGLGSYLITCESNPNDMVNVPCDPAITNFVETNDDTGADILYMTYGYYTDGSGPREFYEVLQKVVE